MNNGDFNSILNTLAENPDTLRKLVAAVGDGGGESVRRANTDVPDFSAYPEKPSESGKERSKDVENLIRLLNALKPYLDADKREKIDGAVRILRIIALAANTGLFDGERRD